MKADGITPEIPEVDPELEYLLRYLAEIGPTMGDRPLSAQEIQAWCAGTGVRLVPWEFRLLLHLSRAYLAESHRAKKALCPPPYGVPAKGRSFDTKLDAFLN